MLYVIEDDHVHAFRSDSFAATSPLLDGIGGVCLKDNDIAPIDDEQKPLTADLIPSDAMSQSLDPDSARRLWDLCEAMLK